MSQHSTVQLEDGDDAEACWSDSEPPVPSSSGDSRGSGAARREGAAQAPNEVLLGAVRAIIEDCDRLQRQSTADGERPLHWFIFEV